MSQIISNDRKDKLSKWYKIGIAALACLVISPIIFMVVKGLVGLILALSLGLTAVNLAPWFSIKLATWSLKLIKQDAMENPVETRQQIEQENEQKLTEFMNEIESFAAQVMSFGDKVREIVRKYPDRPDTQQYVQQLAGMQELLSVRKRAWQQAREDLKSFKAETVEISDLWDMAQAAVKMGKLAGNMKNNPMDELRIRVANDAVHNKMNMAMSQLSTALMEESSNIPVLNVVQPEVLTLDMKDLSHVSVNR